MSTTTLIDFAETIEGQRATAGPVLFSEYLYVGNAKIPFAWIRGNTDSNYVTLDVCGETTRHSSIATATGVAVKAEFNRRATAQAGDHILETEGDLMKRVFRLDRYHSQWLVTAIAQTALDSDEWHNALADLQNAIGVMDGGWASVYDWEDWDNYDLNTRSQVITEYIESELRAERGTA